MRQINKIIVHCSATREGENYSVDTIRSWHVDGRGWSDIGYHFYIDIHGVEVDGKTPKDTRTEEQENSLLAVLRTLKAMYPEVMIHSHNDFANKACPSFDATEEYKNL